MKKLFAPLMAFIVIAGCGIGAGSPNPALSIQEIALQSGDLPGGMHRCDNLSGKFPDVSKNYGTPADSEKAWTAAYTFGAVEAWAEVYVDDAKFCTSGAYAGPTDLGATAATHFVQNLLIRYRNEATAEQAFQTGHFVPQQDTNWLKGPVRSPIAGSDVLGDRTGLGPNSRVYFGQLLTFSAYVATWQQGDYVASVWAVTMQKDNADSAARRIDGRIPKVIAQQSSSPCAGRAAGGTGSISGDHLGYPGPGVPPLSIYAIRTDDAASYCMVDTNSDQRSYRISGLAGGSYYLLAYPKTMGLGLVGAYTRFVPCGESASCHDHSLVPVAVRDGQTVTGINPNDYYAQAQLPAKPA